MNIAVAILLALGTAFILVAAVGILRMPDVYMRLSASAKAATLGTSCLLLAVAVYFQDRDVTFRVGAIVLFIALTVPVGAHRIGRAAYFGKIPLWDRSVADDAASDGSDEPPSGEAPSPARNREDDR